MGKKKLSKISRVLSIYHLFLSCQEVSYLEVLLRIDMEIKTIQRDVKLLRDAGALKTTYSNEVEAYVNIDTTVIPPYSPEILIKNEELRKINRLCYIMNSYFNYEINGSPYRWYLENIPLPYDDKDQYIKEILKDFEELEILGFRIAFNNPFSFLWDEFDMRYLNENIDDPKYIEENLSKIKKNEKPEDINEEDHNPWESDDGDYFEIEDLYLDLGYLDSFDKIPYEVATEKIRKFKEAKKKKTEKVKK